MQQPASALDCRPVCILILAPCSLRSAHVYHPCTPSLSPLPQVLAVLSKKQKKVFHGSAAKWKHATAPPVLYEYVYNETDKENLFVWVYSMCAIVSAFTPHHHGIPTHPHSRSQSFIHGSAKPGSYGPDQQAKQLFLRGNMKFCEGGET